MAQLTYSLAEGLLIGTANGKPVHIALRKSGGKDTTSGGVFLKFRFATVATGEGQVPPGVYSISPPFLHESKDGEGFFQCARLTPANGHVVTGGDGFLIHGGSHDCDGCIVPDNAAEFHALMSALAHDGGGTLVVVRHPGAATSDFTIKKVSDRASPAFFKNC